MTTSENLRFGIPSRQPNIDAVCSSFVTYRTSQYKLHYYETPTNIKFVMLTDVKSPNMRVALQQIYINLYVEYGKMTWYLEIKKRWWLI
jgi:hypothetical protein